MSGCCCILGITVPAVLIWYAAVAEPSSPDAGGNGGTNALAFLIAGCVLAGLAFLYFCSGKLNYVPPKFPAIFQPQFWMRHRVSATFEVGEGVTLKGASKESTRLLWGQQTQATGWGREHLSLIHGANTTKAGWALEDLTWCCLHWCCLHDGTFSCDLCCCHALLKQALVHANRHTLSEFFFRTRF